MQDRYQYHWFNERVTLVKVGCPARPNTSLAVFDSASC